MKKKILFLSLIFLSLSLFLSGCNSNTNFTINDENNNQVVNDHDGDGFLVPEDCDDLNPNINPGIEEKCGDAIDNNCNQEIDENCQNYEKIVCPGVCQKSEIDCNGHHNVVQNTTCIQQNPDKPICCLVNQSQEQNNQINQDSGHQADNEHNSIESVNRINDCSGVCVQSMTDCNGQALIDTQECLQTNNRPICCLNNVNNGANGGGNIPNNPNNPNVPNNPQNPNEPNNPYTPNNPTTEIPESNEQVDEDEPIPTNTMPVGEDLNHPTDCSDRNGECVMSETECYGENMVRDWQTEECSQTDKPICCYNPYTQADEPNNNDLNDEPQPTDCSDRNGECVMSETECYGENLERDWETDECRSTGDRTICCYPHEDDQFNNNGVCLQTAICHDTDGQYSIYEDFLNKGTVSGEDCFGTPFSYTDYCQGNILVEYSCEEPIVNDNGWYSRQVDCTIGNGICVNGECVCNPENDADGDGVCDDIDECPNTPANTQVDWKGCN